MPILLEGSEALETGLPECLNNGPGYASFDRFHKTVPDQIPIESFRDFDMELGCWG